MAQVPVSAGGYPLIIPADDGGTWNLIQDPGAGGISCPVVPVVNTTAAAGLQGAITNWANLQVAGAAPQASWAQKTVLINQ